MKYKAEGNSTVIISEPQDSIIETEQRSKESYILDKGGVVIICRGQEACETISRPAGDFRIK